MAQGDGKPAHPVSSEKAPHVSGAAIVPLGGLWGRQQLSLSTINPLHIHAVHAACIAEP